MGDIFIKGGRVNGLPPYKRNTPLVFQEYALSPHMTVEENITYGLKLQNLDKQSIQKRMEEMLKMFNLVGLEKRFPKQLSGGQQQRVAFARALIMGQEVLLLDEPLSNLDAKLRVEVRSELRQIQRKLGITTIYVTHDQDEALSMSDLIAVMRAGRIEQVGTPWQVYFKPENRFVADFVGTVNFLDVDIIDIKEDKIFMNWQGSILAMNRGDYALHIGETATLAVRPECIELKPANIAEASDTANMLHGEITFYSFLGRYIRYWVKVKDYTFIIDDSNPSLSGAAEGEVFISLDQNKLHILQKNEVKGNTDGVLYA
jgi:ABC-type Fe3+/spermidine/putrescine transport system ATPase subunit